MFHFGFLQILFASTSNFISYAFRFCSTHTLSNIHFNAFERNFLAVWAMKSEKLISEHEKLFWMKSSWLESPSESSFKSLRSILLSSKGDKEFKSMISSVRINQSYRFCINFSVSDLTRKFSQKMLIGNNCSSLLTNFIKWLPIWN